MDFLGLRLGNETQLSVADIQSLGALAEEHGYGEVWVTEGAGRSTTPLTAIAAVTSHWQGKSNASSPTQQLRRFPRKKHENRFGRPEAPLPGPRQLSPTLGRPKHR